MRIARWVHWAVLFFLVSHAGVAWARAPKYAGREHEVLLSEVAGAWQDTAAATQARVSRILRDLPPEQGLNWSPSGSNISLTPLDWGRVSALLVSDTPSHKDRVKRHAVAVVSQQNRGKVLAFGADPTGDALGGVPELELLLRHLSAWLTRNPPESDGRNITITVYNTESRPSVLAWVRGRFPAAQVRTTQDCGPGGVLSCLAGSRLIVIGDSDPQLLSRQEMRALHRHVRLRQKGLLFFHTGGGINQATHAIARQLRVLPESAPKRDLVVRTESLTRPLPEGALEVIRETVEALHQSPLVVEDYQECLDAERRRVHQCATEPFFRKVLRGWTLLQRVLGYADAQELRFMEAQGYVVLKKLVALGHQLRSGTSGAPSVSYPIAVDRNAVALAQAVFAESTRVLSHGFSDGFQHIGDLGCSSSALKAGECENYDSHAVPLHSATRAIGGNGLSGFRSAAVFAVRGIPFTIDVPSDAPGDLVFVVNYQRTGTVNSLRSPTGYSRPMFPRSHEVRVSRGTRQRFSAPVGGPLYVRFDVAPGADIEQSLISFESVGLHPVYREGFSELEGVLFNAVLEASTLPIVEVLGDRFEAYVRRDLFLDGARKARSAGFSSSYDYGGDGAHLARDLLTHGVNHSLDLAGLARPGQDLRKTLPSALGPLCDDLGWDCFDTEIHSLTQKKRAVMDNHPRCGSGCAGNPYEISGALSPLGWGNLHELGHGLQRKDLQLGWYFDPERVDFAHFKARTQEVSNNVFPFWSQWRFVHDVLDTHVSPASPTAKRVFGVIQSIRSGLSVEGQGGDRGVLFDNGNCSRTTDYDLNDAHAYETFAWSSGKYAVRQGLRFAHYRQLPMIMADFPPVSAGDDWEGVDIWPLLYAHARLLAQATVSPERWQTSREQLGFGLFPYHGHRDFGGRTVANLPGNDVSLVVLSFLTSRDFGPYYELLGIRTTAVAREQARLHGGRSGRYRVLPPRLYTGASGLPPRDLQGAPYVLLETGAERWPEDGWHPRDCL